MKLEYNACEIDFINECRKNLENTNGYLVPPLEGEHPYGIRPLCGSEIGKELTITCKVQDAARAHLFLSQLLYEYTDDNGEKKSMSDFFGITDVSVSCQHHKDLVIYELENIIAKLKSGDD